MPIQDATAPLRKVYVRPPRPEDADAWRAYGWHERPDPDLAVDEHAAFRELLTSAGAEVVEGNSEVPADPDAIYAYDPALLTDRGVILLRPGKPGRRDEPEALGTDLEHLGLPILARLRAPAVAEGGDMFWLDPTTLLVGRGYRTNDDGVAQLRVLLEQAGNEVIEVDLPHFRGPDACLHLMSFISPLDRDLAVVFAPMMPVRLMDLLRLRGVRLIEVPEEEFATQGPNVLALGPRIALALEGSPETRRRLEDAGVDVRTYRGEQISHKGDGGPTCLTRPLERG
jgi:N-dimethylarginine dimethylaminohydrolase